MKRRDFTVLAPWSRKWWCAWFRLALAGTSTRAMVFAAERGKSFQVRAVDVGSDLGWTAITVGGTEHKAWRVHLAGKGISMPQPRRAPVIFVPTTLPASIINFNSERRPTCHL
jgi:hypothetical protein